MKSTATLLALAALSLAACGQQVPAGAPEARRAPTAAAAPQEVSPQEDAPAAPRTEDPLAETLLQSLEGSPRDWKPDPQGGIRNPSINALIMVAQRPADTLICSSAIPMCTADESGLEGRDMALVGRAARQVYIDRWAKWDIPTKNLILSGEFNP